MEQLIFFAFIIFLSVVESLARSRRAKKAKERGTAPEGDPRYDFEWAQKSPDELPTYDDDPSYDDMASYDEEITSYDDAVEEDRVEPSRGRPSTETVLPGNLFEELAALAGQLEAEQEKARTIRIPRESPPLPEPEEPLAIPTRGGSRASVPRPPRRATPVRVERAPMRVPTRSLPQRPDHFVHSSHADYGTDPSERAPSAQDVLDPLRRPLSEDAAAVRKQLMSHSPSALRQAIILNEVLGPPLAMRE